MNFFKTLSLFSVSVLILLGSQPSSASLPPDFDFYFGDFLAHQLDSRDPMAELINRGLAESLFQASNEREFLGLARHIRRSLDEHPERLRHYLGFNWALHQELERRIEHAEYTRKLYSATGAVVGVLIGIPAGHFLSQSFGSKLYWLVVPAAGLAGAGFGFVLADLRHAPPVGLDSEVFLEDLNNILDELRTKYP